MSEVCGLCGTWVCARCGWSRRGAALASGTPQDCYECGSTDGEMHDIRHLGWKRHE